MTKYILILIKKYQKQIEIGSFSVFVLVVAFFVFNWSMDALIHNRDEIIVPKIEGKSLYEAIGMVSYSGLGLIKEAEEYNSKLPPGTVLRQVPSPGMIVKEGKIVRIVISKGSDLIFVPDIIGKEVKIAELEVRRSQLVLNAGEQIYSLRFDKNKIISQTPVPNTVVEKNTEVKAVVSLGNPPESVVLMPDFVGKDVNEIKTWAVKNSIHFEFREQEYQSSADNIVLSQEPSPDTAITVDTYFSATISKNLTILPQTPESKNAEEPFRYDVPMGSRDQEIRIVLVDSSGEHEVYLKVEAPGKEISIPIIRKGKAKVRVFVDNILVQESELK